MNIIRPKQMPSFADALMQGQQFAQQRQANKQAMQMNQQQLKNAQIQEMVNNMGLDEARKKKMLGDFEIAARFLQQGNQQGAIDFLTKRAVDIQNNKGNPEDTIELVQEIATNPQQAFGKIQALTNAFKTQAPEKGRYKVEDGGFIFDTATGKLSVNPEMQKRAQKLAQKPQLSLSDKRSINSDISKFTAEAKSIRQTAVELEKLKDLGGGPASIAAVFKFMKALDPTSVVREGEFATAENSAGIDGTIRNYYNKLLEGERLGDEQFNNFIVTAQTIANSAVDAAENEVNKYLNTFDENDFGQKARQKFIDRIPKRIEIKPSAPLGPVVTYPEEAVEALRRGEGTKEQFIEMFGGLPEGF